MKKTFLFAAMASMVLASCTTDEQVFDVAKAGKEIRFDVVAGTAQTRAEHDIDAPYDGKLQIWAWEEGTANAIINGDVYDAANKTFASGKSYYYPADGDNVDFVAVPVETISKTNANGDEESYFNAPVRTTDGKTTMNFSTPAGILNHATDAMTTELVSQNSGTVPMILRHLMAKLNIRVQQTARFNAATQCLVTLNDLQIRKAHINGAVAIDQDWTAVNGGNDRLWDTTKGDGTWDVVTADYPLCANIDPAFGDVTNFETSEAKFVLPQDLANGQELYIKYTVQTKYLNDQPTVTEVFEKTIPLKDIAANIQTWAMNKNITYVISINPLEVSNMITFEFNVEEWGVQESNPNNFDRLNP
jgi:hypothetical protein